MKLGFRNRINPGGCWFAAVYIVIVIVVFAATTVMTEPDNVGLDWIPFSMLAMPWYGLDARLLLTGFIVNTALMYLLGTVLHSIWRSAKEWG